ncbi:MAG: hypothetical protein DRI90_24925 [Deltaproteobacteria bacterium]|nr:MAG: hypothetical protein DRI90_24925 [Deltaproteobacteria bacterium]
MNCSATRFLGTLALGLLLIAPALGHSGCDAMTGIDELTFGRGVDSFCGPDHPCPDGTYCELTDGRCQPQQDDATQCALDAECRSGRCRQGFCCNGPCNTICAACDLPGSEGYCSVVPPGEDPHGHCTGTTACGADGWCEGRCLWSLSGGDSGPDLAVDVAIDGQDEIFIVGTFEGTLNLGDTPLNSVGDRDVFLAKLTSNGETLWSQSFGSPAADQAAAVAVDHDGNVIVAANFAGPVTLDKPYPTVDGVDAFIIKLDGEGELLTTSWLRLDNDLFAVTEATDVAVDPEGNVIATGHYTMGIQYGSDAALLSASPYANVFVVKLDTTLGSTVWSQELGGGDTFAVQGGAVAVGGSEFIILSLVGQGAVGSANNTTLNGSTVDDDLYLLRLAASGLTEWGLLFDGEGDQHSGGLAVDLGPDESTTSIWLTGTFADELTIPTGDDFTSEDDQDGFYVQLDLSGTPRASGALAGPFDEVPQAVTIDQEGNAIIVGHFELALEATEDEAIYAAGGTDLFLVKLDWQAQHTWARPFGGVLHDGATSIATDSGGNLVVVGHFEHALNLGCGATLEAVGDSDFFIAKLAP